MIMIAAGRISKSKTQIFINMYLIDKEIGLNNLIQFRIKKELQ